MNLSGNPFDFIIVFFSGILVSFTPCVYPLIPVVIGYIAPESSGSRLKGLFLSFVYVSGVAVTYALLGLLASWSGTLFGTISAHPLTRFLVGTVIIFFGLSMLDLFRLPLPNIIRKPVLKKGDYFSTFILGLSSGLIVSPCLTPVLGSILVYLATKQQLFYGATLLITFAYGMGFTLILAGTFSSLLVNIPKGGRWMLWIKRLGAGLLIMMGAYLSYSGATSFKKQISVAEEVKTTLNAAKDFQLRDISDGEVILSSYKFKQPVLLFFWTTWCPFCRQELKRLNDRYAQISNDGLVVLPIDVGESKNLVADFLSYYRYSLRVFLDKDSQVADSYAVMGVPTYILIDKIGNIVFKGNNFPQEKYKEYLR